MENVYINRTAKFLPNQPLKNEDLDDYIGLLNNSERVKKIVLRSNGILTRYYALDKAGKATHSNADITYKAIRGLLDDQFKMDNIDLLSVGTSSPDHIVPSHAVMVHGLMKESRHLEINAASGNCTSGMNALKYAYMSVRSGLSRNAVVAGSERASSWISHNKFDYELEAAGKLEEKPVLAFEKEFLRWMLSDGAGAFLLQNHPGLESKNHFKIEWIDGQSFADSIEACMYAGAEKRENGSLTSWMDYPSDEWADKSLFSIKQDIRLLDEHIIDKGVKSLKTVIDRNGFNIEELDYFLPHISSLYFKDKLLKGMKASGMAISDETLYTNLSSVGNIGAGAIFVMLDELSKNKDLKKGESLLLSVPESGRFNYVYALLTVV